MTRPCARAARRARPTGSAIRPAAWRPSHADPTRCARPRSCPRAGESRPRFPGVYVGRGQRREDPGPPATPRLRSRRPVPTADGAPPAVAARPSLDRCRNLRGVDLVRPSRRRPRRAVRLHRRADPPPRPDRPSRHSAPGVFRPVPSPPCGKRPDAAPRGNSSPGATPRQRQHTTAQGAAAPDARRPRGFGAPERGNRSGPGRGLRGGRCATPGTDATDRMTTAPRPGRPGLAIPGRHGDTVRGWRRSAVRPAPRPATVRRCGLAAPSAGAAAGGARQGRWVSRWLPGGP